TPFKKVSQSEYKTWSVEFGHLQRVTTIKAQFLVGASITTVPRVGRRIIKFLSGCGDCQSLSLNVRHKYSPQIFMYFGQFDRLAFFVPYLDFMHIMILKEQHLMLLTIFIFPDGTGITLYIIPQGNLVKDRKLAL